MKHILSFGISILSVVVGIAVIIGCYITGGKVGLWEGSALWILATLGAPTTFLGWVLSKIGLATGFISSYILVSFFYLLQYQLIAYLIYKEIINLASKSGIIYLTIILITILISAKIMWNIIMGYWV